MKQKKEKIVQVFLHMFHVPCSMFRDSRGQTIFLAALFFLAISLTVLFGVSAPLVSRIESARAGKHSIASFYAGEGVREDVLYRLTFGMPVDEVETVAVGGAFATSTTISVEGGKEIIATGNSANYIRKSRTHLSVGSGASFNYGVQSGEGGVVFENSSSVVGSLSSNGPVIGAERNKIKGDTISAGPTGRIENVHATSSAYAHTIQNATIDKDAYYQTISGSRVMGTLHPGSPDQATTSLPISDAMITQWENDAAAGGIVSSPCPYRIDDNITIGPKKINCDLEISGSPIVTLLGNVWVTGNITVKNSATVRVGSSLDGKSVLLIADNPANQTTSSKIMLENSAVFAGSGSSGSYVLMLSQNKSAEQGGSEKAIDVKNTVDGDLLVYAGHGEIQLQNSIDVKEVSAWRIRLKNSAEVIYETGLTNLLFSSGPSGGYTQDGWRETE